LQKLAIILQAADERVSPLIRQSSQLTYSLECIDQAKWFREHKQADHSSKLNKMSEAKTETNVTTSIINLSGGGTIPTIGLGVYQAATGTETQEAVANAIKLGYRHVDTAHIYRN
jgi:hypothetical protein